MLKTKIGVIADDFTGANDTGLQFSKQGALTGMFLNLSDIDKALNEFDVVVLDTESRFDDKKTAFEKVMQTSRFLKQNGVSHIYKKLDSTMRGNIGAEIDGAIEGACAKAAFVVPAMPSMGRTTAGGICYVNGIAVSQTEAANDPKSPVISSYIPDIIALQSKRNIQCIDLKEVQSGIDALCEKIIRLIKSGSQIIVIDASSDDELEVIAKAVTKVNEQKVFVGSPGFAEFVGKSLKVGSLRRQKSNFMRKKDSVSKSVLIAAGSVSEVTIEQVYFATKERNINVINLDFERMFNQKENEKIRIIETAGGGLASGNDVIIRPVRNREDVEKARKIAAKAGFNGFECSENIGLFIGDTISRICKEFKPGGLVLTGGDIAIKIIKAMGVTGTIIKDEVLPGIASGNFVSNEFGNVTFVTKAGAFGKEDALIKIIDYLKAI